MPLVCTVLLARWGWKASHRGGSREQKAEGKREPWRPATLHLQNKKLPLLQRVNCTAIRGHCGSLITAFHKSLSLSLLSADFPLLPIWSFKSLCSIRTAGKPPSYVDASLEITALLPGCLWGSAERTCLIFRLLGLHGSCRHFRCDHGGQDA